MGVLRLRAAMALVACATLFLTGCPEPRGKDNQGVVQKENPVSEQAELTPTAKSEHITTKADSHGLAGTWVCKTLESNGRTVTTSELTFGDGTMTWVHPKLNPGGKGGPRRLVETAYSVSKDKRLFGVLLKQPADYEPMAGEPFSAVIVLDGDELTIREVKPAARDKSTAGDFWDALQGVYRKKSAAR